MDKTLLVYLGEEYIGKLVERNGQTLRFTYDEKAKSIISLAMPIQKAPYYNKETFAFFENLLPEEEVRTQIAKMHRVSENNPFSLLSVIGEDCAGAIHLHHSKPNIEPSTPKLLTQEELLSLVKSDSSTRYSFKSKMRLSLAGAQEKTTLLISNDNYYIPTFDFPSTNILKYPNIRFGHILFNELFCSLLAKKCDLPTSNMKVEYVDKNPYLLIDRFDRKSVEGKIIRIHQEDFCQLNFVSSKQKYQKEKGPGFSDVIATIRKYSMQTARDITLIAKILVFNYLIGNCDYHGKNLAMLHSTKSLSPFYDLVSTTVYPNLSTNMAMSVNRKDDINDITKQDIIVEFNKWGISGAPMLTLIMKDFQKIGTSARELLNEPMFNSARPFLDDIVSQINQRFEKLSS